MLCTFLGRIDGKVTLTDLFNFPNYESRGDAINIVKQIAGTRDYKIFGNQLLNDTLGTEISILENSPRFDVVGVVTEVFKAWINGMAGVHAKRTWRVLVHYLRLTNLNAVADNIENFFNVSPHSEELNPGEPLGINVDGKRTMHNINLRSFVILYLYLKTLTSMLVSTSRKFCIQKV